MGRSEGSETHNLDAAERAHEPDCAADLDPAVREHVEALLALVAVRDAATELGERDGGRGEVGEPGLALEVGEGDARGEAERRWAAREGERGSGLLRGLCEEEREGDAPVRRQGLVGFGVDGGDEAAQVAEDVGRLELVVDVLMGGKSLGLRNQQRQHESERELGGGRAEGGRTCTTLFAE